VSLLFINPANKTSGVILAILGVCVLFGIQQLRYPELSGLRGHLSRGIQNQRQLIAGSVVVGQMLDGIRKAESITDIIFAIGSGLEELCFTRFELLLRCDQIKILHLSFNGWEYIPAYEGGFGVRWTSKCEHCERLKITDDGRKAPSSLWENCDSISGCVGCEAMKNPILQKNSRATIIKNNSLCIENQIRLAIYSQNGTDLGSMSFFHPACDDYPVSAISILSQNIGRELEKAIQRVLSE
jgi:hypothetical protein